MFNRFAAASLAAIAATVVSLPAHAVTVTQWNFNSTPPDNNLSTGSTLPVIGDGTASLVGGVTGGFASGAANGGSSDPAPVDNTGWQTTGYRAQGAGDKTAGVQFMVSTVGWQGISVSYDLRHSNTSSRYEQVQYTLDGVSWMNATQFAGVPGDTWFNGRTVNFGTVAGANNNANFGFRVVAAFEPGSTRYVASTDGSSYAPSGTWRFDMATVSAQSAITPVPEPASWALMLAGAGVVGAVARRRRA